MIRFHLSINGIFLLKEPCVPGVPCCAFQAIQPAKQVLARFRQEWGPGAGLTEGSFRKGPRGGSGKAHCTNKLNAQVDELLNTVANILTTPFR